MPRPSRPELAGAVHHITTRGVRGEALFLEETDRRRFLDFLGREIVLRRWICHAYCLLEREYELILETPEVGLGRGLARLNATYAQWFNRRYGRGGALFHDRYRTVVVEKGEALLALCRHVVLGPLRAGLVARLDQWPWSSYRATGFDQSVPRWLDTGWILARFDDDADTARAAYRRYVSDGREAPSPRPRRGSAVIGSEPFVAVTARRLRSRPDAPDPRRPDRDEVIEAVAAAADVSPAMVLDRTARPEVFRVAIYLLRRAADMTLREVAAAGGVSAPRVSQIQRSIDTAGGLARAFPWAEDLERLIP